MFGNVIGGVSGVNPYAAENRVNRKKKSRSTVGEKRLSAKAQKYLEGLRDDYSDFDMIVADEDDDRPALLADSDKEFAVVLSSDEIEKMADDIRYAEGKLNRLQSIVEMSTRICEENGFVLPGGGKPSAGGGYLKSLTFAVNNDGSMQFTAELEDLSGKSSLITASDENDFVKKLQMMKG